MTSAPAIDMAKIHKLEQLFKQGGEEMEAAKSNPCPQAKVRAFNNARCSYEKILQIDPDCVEALNNLGVVLCELDHYSKALEAYSKINADKRTAKTWYNIVLAHYYSRDYDQALQYIQNILDVDAYKIIALDLKGKIHIEQEDYPNAMISFNHAFTASSEPIYLLWEAYALYLLSEFRSDVDEKTQRKLLHILIRRLERLDKLALKYDKPEIHEQTIYYLGCAYSRYKDYVTAISKLEECLQENTKAEVSLAARRLLEQDWNQLRPPLWRWWLQSPLFLNRSTKKSIFIATLTLLTLIIVFFLLHPFITVLNPSVELQADWSVYLFVAGLLVMILLFPSVEHIKTKDLEIKMHASSPLDPFPSPAMMENYIGQMSHEKLSHRG